jgi:hypothetical protein
MPYRVADKPEKLSPPLAYDVAVLLGIVLAAVIFVAGYLLASHITTPDWAGLCATVCGQGHVSSATADACYCVPEGK